MPRALLASLRLALISAACLAASPGIAAGQAECATSDCPLALPSTPALSETRAEAARIHEHKLEFVAALQAFARAQAGTFGDEGPLLLVAVDGMAAALSRWDAAIERFRAGSSRLGALPDAYLARATVYLERLRLDDAVRELTAASRIDPERADVHALQALAYATAGRHADAVRAMRRAVAIAPDNPPLFYALARQSLLLGKPEDALAAYRSFTRAVARQASARGGERPRRFDRIGLLRQAEGIAPLFPHARYVAGFEALRSGDYGAAIVRLREAALGDPLNARAPESATAIANAAAALRSGDLGRAIAQLSASAAITNESEVNRLLGLAYWLDERPEAATAALDGAVRLRPDDDRARLLLADVLTAGGRAASAEQVLLAGGSVERLPGAAQFALSQLYEQRSHLDGAAEALRHADRAAAIIGQDALYAALGRVLVNQAAFDDAVAAYGRRIDVNPNHADSHRLIGDVFFLQGRHEEALAEFTAAVWLDPMSVRAHAGIGHVHVRLEQLPEAVAAFRRALSLDAEATEARYALASALVRLGQRSEAALELERVRREQNDAFARGQLRFKAVGMKRNAADAAAAGRPDEAIATLQDVIALAPEDADARRQLASALLAATRHDEAIAALERAEQLQPTADGAAALADAYARAGRADAARAALARRDELVAQRKQRAIERLTGR